MKKIFLLLLLILYSNCFSQWANTNSPHFTEIAVSGNNLFGIDAVSGVYISTNNGANWAQTALNTSGLVKITAVGPNIFAGTGNTANKGIYRSTNSGSNWTFTSFPPTELYGVTTIAIDGNNIYASTGYHVYYSTDNGNNWTQTTNITFYIYSLAISGSTIFAGAEATGVYISTNNCASWSQTSLNNRNIISVKINGTNIFAGTDNNVYFSTNSGTNWAPTSLGSRYISSLLINAGNIFAGTDNGVYISKNNGSSWLEKNEGLSGDILDAPRLSASGNYIFASNLNSNTWRRDLSEIITVRQISEIIPKEYKLIQNYPNPFNPTTKINFSLPVKSFTSLKVYSLTGKIIADLVNENLNAGSYEYLFNASSFPSGTYFYRLETEDYSETKLMLLLK